MDVYGLIPNMNPAPEVQAQLSSLLAEAEILRQAAAGNPDPLYQRAGELAAQGASLIVAGAPIAEIQAVLGVAKQIVEGHPEAIVTAVADQAIAMFDPAVAGFEVLLAGPPSLSSGLDAAANILGSAAAVCGVLAVCFPPAGAVAVALGTASVSVHTGADVVRTGQSIVDGAVSVNLPGLGTWNSPYDEIVYTPEEAGAIDESLETTYDWLLNLFDDELFDPFAILKDPKQPPVNLPFTTIDDDIFGQRRSRKIEMSGGKVVAVVAEDPWL